MVFGDRDLYAIFPVGNPNAKYLRGRKAKDFKDIDGDRMGIASAAHKPEGEITTIDYEFSGADKTPVSKQTFTTKVDGLVCGVGYY